MRKPRVVIVKLSDSFADLWTELADDIGAEVSVREREMDPVGPQAAAVVLAAGGAEQQAIEWLHSHAPPASIPLFAVGADPDRRTAIQLAGNGASDYFALPEDLELLRNAIESAVDRRTQEFNRAAAFTEEAGREAFSEIIGESPALKEVLRRAAKVLSHGDATILIVGETGTGKELLARAVHYGGPRRARPFVPVNCSALPENLIESELFGHERGAFTDAHATKPGLFEVAEGGTLFLDEVGTLPVKLQAKLLRVLQDKRIRRVGGTRPREVDVRIIAATNDDLRRALKEGRFRQDLYYRLGVITLSLPTLRERGDDVILIAQALVTNLAGQYGVPRPAISGQARRALLSYSWPGNVRELKNAVERTLLLSAPDEFDVGELVSGSEPPVDGSGPIPFPAPLDEITTAAARATLELCGGNRSEAARRLSISRRRLRRLLGESSELEEEVTA